MTSPTTPLPPSNLDRCLAASPAAALLSVSAVVTGIGLSTPESNAMTGIFAAFACSMRGAAALLSSAANPMASGFFAITLVSIVICFSTSASVGGPSNVILAPSFLASVLAPFWTACPNCAENLGAILAGGPEGCQNRGQERGREDYVRGTAHRGGCREADHDAHQCYREETRCHRIRGTRQQGSRSSHGAGEGCEDPGHSIRLGCREPNSSDNCSDGQ